MIRVCFQNGPDAPEIVLDEKFETKAEAESQLDWFAQHYGTDPAAAAWVEGDRKPKALVSAEKQLAAREEELAAEAEPSGVQAAGDELEPDTDPAAVEQPAEAGTKKK
jgi:hypothetical protein